jgi:hypothetical protein
MHQVKEGSVSGIDADSAECGIDLLRGLGEEVLNISPTPTVV